MRGEAAQIPFTALAPRTLVLKLAGMVQYLATGDSGHTINCAEVTGFFELLVTQLHDFPQPPADYRPQTDELDFESTRRVRLVVGVSGAGKTAWASHAALMHPSLTAYFDIGELPGSALASLLRAELVARFLMRGEGAGAAALPAASGLELLRWVSRHLTEVGDELIVVLDNVHRVSALATLQQMLSAAADTRFVLLGQAWPGQAELEARLEIKAERLGGWSLDDAVAVFAAAGCRTGASTGQHILEITAGIPLYIKNSAQLTVDTYSGDAGTFVQTVMQRLNVVGTAQEIVLTDTFERLGSKLAMQQRCLT